ncbi:orotate phosphoribosyltransferase [Salinibacillus kushneri]|uniref:Orotate phosphoribosyltransferase n=1 Tax=Salinibacillus kushneri TaxID=237682 RepID=A0A1I0HMY6_9BACI|nr:orotate phosphoribosyltransferase [Salinibacillus kushneri]SET84573.1 orotate phosphoribosyltransferase [Salinibacillus kushneri]
MNRKTFVASQLMKAGALQVRTEAPFTWSSGIQSPIYCDNRILMSFPKVRKNITAYFAEVISNQYPETDIIAGCATAGIPHAAWVADQLELPMVYVRGKAKAHGKQNQIEGNLSKGQKVIVIEDLVSTGMSVLNAAKTIERSGGEVMAMLSIFTYGLTASLKNFKSARIRYESLTDFDTLLSHMNHNKQISQQQKEDLLKWRDHLSIS